MRITRKYDRYVFSEAINVRRHSPAAIVPAIALEICQGGMSAIIPDSLRVGEETELLVSTPFDRLLLPAIVRNKNQFRYGFEFTAITDEQRERIRQLCDSLIRYTGGIDQE